MTDIAPPPLSRQLLSIDQVAERWDVSRDLVELAIRKGKLKCLRLSPRNLRVPVEALEEYERTASLGSSPLAPEETLTRDAGPSSTTSESQTPSGPAKRRRDPVASQQARLLRTTPARSSRNG